VRARLFDDMAPFHFQIEAAWHHSVWGLDAVKTGVFAPPALVGPVPFADLQAMMGKAETALEAFTPDEVNGWAGKDLDLQIGPRRPSSSRFRCPTSISMPSPPTPSCDRGACLSASATTRAGCVPSRLTGKVRSPPRSEFQKVGLSNRSRGATCRSGRSLRRLPHRITPAMVEIGGLVADDEGDDARP
jgi:hypothetical protein